MAPELISNVWNTLAVSGLSVALAVPLGTVLAILLFRFPIGQGMWAWLAVASQIAIPLYVFAGAWSAGFGLQGWIANLAAELWGESMRSLALQSSIGSVWMVGAIHGLAAIPWVCLIVGLGLCWTERGLEDTALIDGGLKQLLFMSILPRLYPWILASAVWSAVPALTEMVVSNLYQVPTVAEQVYLNASQGTGDAWPVVYALLFCLATLLLGVWIWSRQLVVLTNYPRLSYFRPQLQSNGGSLLPSLCVWLFLAGLVGLPLFNLLAKAGWQPQVVATGETSYTWSYLRFGVTLYESITLYSREYYWSGLLAAGASSIALLAAIVLRLLTRSYGSFVIVSAAMFGIVVIPGPIVGSWVIGLLNRPYPLWLGQLYDNTLAAPILAQQFRLLPLAWLLTTTIVASISPRTWQQAQLDGLHWTARLRWVVLPQTWASWIMAALLLVVTSIGELSCSILVLPPGVTTLSMRLFEMLHFGMRHQDSGLCLILVLVGWLVAGIGWKTLSDR